MKKLKNILFLFFLAINVGNTKTNSDTIIINRIIVSNSAITIINNSLDPGDSVEKITSKDKIIFYNASISVINPTKKNYNLELICTDSKNNIVIQSILKISPIIIESYIEEDTVGQYILHLGLNPNPSKMVENQRIPLISNQDYFIKLYFDKKLLAITNFQYVIES